MTDTTTPAAPAPNAPWWKKKWVWIVAIIVLIAIGANAGKKSDAKKVASGSTTTTTTSTKADTSDAPAAAPKIGEDVKVGRWTVHVYGTQDPYVATNQYTQPQAGMRLISVDMSLTNRTAQSETFAELASLKVKAADNREYSVHYSGEGLPSIGGDYAKQETKRGTTLFEIPTDATGLAVVVAGDFGGETKVSIPLS